MTKRTWVASVLASPPRQLQPAPEHAGTGVTGLQGVVMEKLQTVRVLLVEDYGPTVVAIRAVLERSKEASFEVQVAVRLSNALEQITAAGVDVVLLDLDLADSKGLATLRKLRAATPGTPVIVLTAHEERDIGRGALEAGAQDFFMKSQIEARVLARAILRVCPKKRP